MGNLVRESDAIRLDSVRPDVKRAVYAESETYGKKYFPAGFSALVESVPKIMQLREYKKDGSILLPPGYKQIFLALRHDDIPDSIPCVEIRGCQSVEIRSDSSAFLLTPVLKSEQESRSFRFPMRPLNGSAFPGVSFMSVSEGRISGFAHSFEGLEASAFTSCTFIPFAGNPRIQVRGG